MTSKTSIWERILVGEFDYGDVLATILRAYCLPLIVIVLALLPNSEIILLDGLRFILVSVGIAAFFPTGWQLATLGPRLLLWITVTVGAAFALLGVAAVIWYAAGADFPIQFKTFPSYLTLVFAPLVALMLVIGWIVLPIRLYRHRRNQSRVAQ